MANKIDDMLLDEIINDLQKEHECHTFILYGSRARDEQTISSDYDIIAVRDNGEFERDCRIFKGFYLDAFIYSEDVINNPDLYLIRAKDGIVLSQKNHIGDELLNKITTIYNQGPPKTPVWEKNEISVWLVKMLHRTKTEDIEGNFRCHWLLHDLLECYFKMRDQWYLGPKESFKWLKKNDEKTYQTFDSALKPNASFTMIENLIHRVIGHDFNEVITLDV
jgi:predicted nucleotidyltransferase